MPTSLPPLHASVWGDFPPSHLIPAEAQRVIAKLGTLRSRHFEAREAETVARGHIDIVEAEQISKAAEQLAAGEEFTVDSEPVAVARERHEQTIRDVTATQQALATVERELDAAFKANERDAKARVDEHIETTRSAYSDALSAFETARKAHLDAVAAKAWTKDALKPLTEIGRRGGRSPAPNYVGCMSVDPRDVQRFRDEIDPPQLVLSRPVSDAGLAGDLERVDVPSDGWE